jgi:predicted lactoylglutathione lyase
VNRMIFLSLAVADVEVSRAFYAGLGFPVDPGPADGATACVVVSDTLVVMVLQRDRFADLLAGPVGDPATGTTSITSLSAESPGEVDDLVERALRHGGRPWLDKVVDGPVYGHSFTDPDGHVWEVLHTAQPTGSGAAEPVRTARRGPLAWGA